MSNEKRTPKFKMINSRFGMFQSLNQPERILHKVPTGFESIDAITNGGFTEGVHTFVAQPGSGKSTLALNIALNAMKADVPVLFCSFEMPEEDLLSKIYSMVSCEFAKNGNGFSFDDLRSERKRTSAEIKLFDQTKAWVETNLDNKLGLEDFTDNKITVDDILFEAQAFIEYQQKKPLVIVDYLQTIASDGNYVSTKENLDQIMLKLHSLATKHHFPIIAISSISKQSSTESLTMFSGAESARIAYSSVSVWGLWEDPDKAGHDSAYKSIILKNFKNRYGQSGTSSHLNFDGEHSRFFEFKEIVKGNNKVKKVDSSNTRKISKHDEKKGHSI